MQRDFLVWLNEEKRIGEGACLQHPKRPVTNGHALTSVVGMSVVV